MSGSNHPKPPLIAVAVTFAAFLLLYIPLVFLVVSSFVQSPLVEGPRWTLDWYAKALSNTSVLDGLRTSLIVGFFSTVIATVLGTGAALALERRRFVGHRIFDTIVHLPLVMPEIVMGLSLLIWFVALRITLGTFSIVLAHVTFSLSYVIITVRARLHDFDQSLEEAARDLGASPRQVFTRVTFPLIWPGVLSGALLAFTLSFDDFLITFFTAGVGSDTLPLKIYAMIKFGVSPEISALSSLTLGATLILVLFLFRPNGTGPVSKIRRIAAKKHSAARDA